MALRRSAVGFAVSWVLLAGCAPAEPTTTGDPIAVFVCSLMPTVREVRVDVSDLLVAARAANLGAMNAAAERAKVASSSLTRTLQAPSAPRMADSPQRLGAIVSVAILGEQAWSWSTAGLPDGRSIAQFQAVLSVADQTFAQLESGLRDAGLTSC